MDVPKDEISVSSNLSIREEKPEKKSLQEKIGPAIKKTGAIAKAS